MPFWSAFIFGVLAGILAGVGINIGIDFVRTYIAKKKTIKYLKFEIDFNMKKLDSFLEKLRTFRARVKLDSIADAADYVGYISLTEIITTTITQMFHDRSIYKKKKLDYEEIGKLQNFVTFFTIDMERFLNNQIQRVIEHSMDSDIKKKANKTIDFWENAFKSRKNDLYDIKFKLK